MRLRNVVWGATFAALVLAGSTLRAQGPNGEPERDVFLSQVQSGIARSSIQEVFNPYSGQITLRVTLVDLPARGGLDTVLQAYYHSEIWNRTDLGLHTHVASIDTADNLGGGGWQFHFGKIFNPNGLGSPNQATFDNPLLIMPDGSTRLFFNDAVTAFDFLSVGLPRFRGH